MSDTKDTRADKADRSGFLRKGEGAKQPAKQKVPLQVHMQSDFGAMMQVFDLTTHMSASPYIETTSVRVPDAIYRSSLVSETRFLSEEFLLNCKSSSIELGFIHGVSNYSSFPVRAGMSLVDTKDAEARANSDVVELPPYEHLNARLGSTIRARRSNPAISGKPITLRQLSTLLFYSNGTNGSKKVISPASDSEWPTTSLGQPSEMPIRNSPSGGGLYPIHLYLVLQNVKGLEDGLYRYLPISHCLSKVRDLTETDWADHFADGESWGLNVEVERVNVSMFYVYELYANSRKYGNLGMNFAFIEIGAIAQNFHLVASALGLASNCMAGSSKTMREKFFGIDGLSKHALHLSIAGQPDRSQSEALSNFD